MGLCMGLCMGENNRAMIKRVMGMMMEIRWGKRVMPKTLGKA